MPKDDLHNNGEFPETNKADWQQAARVEIDDKDPFETLQWNSGELIFAPYYDATDAIATAYLKNFDLLPAKENFNDPRHWENMPPVDVGDVDDANARALQHLNAGADGILFILKTEPLDFKRLLKNIEWPYCSISFRLPWNNAAFTQLEGYSNEIGYMPESLHGSFFWDTFPNDTTAAIRINENFKNLKTLGIHIHEGSPEEQIAAVLTQTVKHVEQQQRQFSAEKILRAISTSLPVDRVFLVEAAKLKALRVLWYQILRAYDVANAEELMLHIHSYAAPWMNENFQPHGNLLSSTTAAMSAIAGGCDALTIFSEDENNPMMLRVARNVSSILREEAQYSKVSDPLAGAYALEAVTDTLAKKAWQKFQEAIAK